MIVHSPAWSLDMLNRFLLEQREVRKGYNGVEVWVRCTVGGKAVEDSGWVAKPRGRSGMTFEPKRLTDQPPPV